MQNLLRKELFFTEGAIVMELIACQNQSKVRASKHWRKRMGSLSFNKVALINNISAKSSYEQ